MALHEKEKMPTLRQKVIHNSHPYISVSVHVDITEDFTIHIVIPY